MSQDYVRTARSKGLYERIVIYRHTLRNACIPLITVIGPSLGFLVTGVFITEQLFNIPGVSAITLFLSVTFRFYKQPSYLPLPRSSFLMP